MRKTVLLLALFISILSVKAEEIQFEASTISEVVELDTPFQLVYKINSSARDFQAPEFSSFDIIAGPFQSTSSYSSYVNGKRSHSTTLTFTFTLMPTKKGRFKIPSASIMVDDKKVFSNALTIKVIENSNSNSSNKKKGRLNNRSKSQKLGKKNVFVRTILSKRNIYEQEPVLITYKLYTLVDVSQFTDIQIPDFNGFLKQEVPQSKNKQLSYERFNGKNYGTVVLYQSLLFPQQTGKLEIPRANFKAMLRLRNQRQVRSIFDDFFETYTNVEKTLTAPKVTLSVKELPQKGKPTNFLGGVGHFKIKSKLSTNSLKTNEAVTLTIEISGTGNLKLINTPEIKLPSHFEVYDPKIKNNLKTTVRGISGTKTIEYTFIPRHRGSYKISPIDFTYFDLGSRRYKTISTPAYSLEVEKGDNEEVNSIVGSDFTTKEQVKNITTDIYYIHTNKHQLSSSPRIIFGTKVFWLLFITPLLLVLLVLGFVKKRIKENSNIVLVKNKRAKKEAIKRLKQAKLLLQKGKKEQFYTEITTAIRLYLSDKLTIPTSELNRDTIRQKMVEKNIENKLVDRVFKVLDKSEYATYAPTSAKEDMDNIYDETVNIISELEQMIKRK